MNRSLVLALVVAFIIMYLCFRHRSIRVYRFKRDWCHFCKKSQSEWNRFEVSCWLSRIKTIEIDLESCSASDKKLAERFGVTSVPHTIAVFDSGHTSTHSGIRTSEGYHQWVNAQQAH